MQQLSTKEIRDKCHYIFDASDINKVTNRIDDLNVRLFMVEKAIAIKNLRAPHLEN